MVNPINLNNDPNTDNESHRIHKYRDERMSKCCNSYNAAEALKVHTEVAHREYFNGNLVNTLECHSFNEMFIIAKGLGKHNKIVHERVPRCNCLALVVQ